VTVGPKAQVIIYIGGVHVSRTGETVRTLLGSCIAACLWDPQARVGGMNHFMLPAPANGETEGDLSRFGVHAMELLVGEIQKFGGERRRFQAKVFGGGHVLQTSRGVGCVPEQNERFIRRFLASEAIPVAAEDLGGTHARQVVFHTDTGRAFVKRLAGTGLFQTSVEQEHQRVAEQTLAQSGDITLFDE
jgi:chemotaxis receptor (MCP) glutamine deamidase CheD